VDTLSKQPDTTAMLQYGMIHVHNVCWLHCSRAPGLYSHSILDCQTCLSM